MKFLVPAAISAFALIAPAFAADLQERHHQSSGNTVTVHDTVVQTKFATQYVTVTLGADQAQCTQAAESVDTTTVGSSNQNQYQYHQQGNGNSNQHTEQAQAASTTEAPVMETITSTRTFTSTVMHPTTVAVTTMSQGHAVVVTVTKTITEHVRQTEVVTKTRTKTVHETDHVTETDVVHETQAADSTTTADVADNTTTSDGGNIADVNTGVVTVTDVETSTFFFTTTVDGSAAVETGTTTFTADSSTSTDVGGNIADVTTTGTDSASSTSTADGSNSTDDPQTSLTLDPRVIESAFALDGQETPTPGQVASLTSTNNFINFCLTQNVPLTDGQQIRTGSCNVVPQGFIIAKDKLPSAKFVFPVNFSKIPANQAFTAKLKLNNLQAGAFTNANLNYYAAPAQVNAQGILIGHSHLVIEKINSLNDTEPADPTKFTFFKGLNAALDGDSSLSAAVTAGVAPGVYRMFSINTAANHQPALASIAQHGCMDDGVYFTAE